MDFISAGAIYDLSLTIIRSDFTVIEAKVDNIFMKCY